MDFHLRRAEESDAKTIRRIVREARISPINLDWRRFLVAEAEGKIIGTAQIKEYRDGTRELASVAVLPTWQGKRIASSLIEELLIQEGGDVYLICQEKLLNFYSRFGFQRLESSKHPPRLHRFFRLGNIFFNLTEKVGAKKTEIIIMRRQEKTHHE